MSAAACELNAEMVACCEQYRDSLDQQLASIQARAANAKDSTKKKLDKMETELRSEREKAGVELKHAYASYAAALNADMDHMKTRLTDFDEKARVKMVDAIEAHQANLERVKRKLQSVGR